MKTLSMPLTLVALLLVLSAAASAVPAQGRDSYPSPLDSAEYRAGEVEAVEEAWWAAVLADPNSLESQLRLLIWPRFFAYSTRPPRTSDEWRDLLGRVDENGWTARTVRWRLREALRRERRSIDAPWPDDGLSVGSHRKWATVGPFGIAAAAALLNPVGIERVSPSDRYDADRKFEGVRNESLAWRAFELSSREAQVSPRNLFGRSGAVYFFTAQFELSENTDAWLQFATRGSARVWVGETMVTEIHRERDYQPTVVRKAVALGPGRHRVVVKTTGPFSLLWRDPQGFPVSFTETAPLNENSTPLGRCEPIPDAEPVGLASSSWWKQFKSSQLDSALCSALAAVLAEEGDVVRLHQVLDRLENAPEADPVEVAMFAIPLLSRVDYLPPSRSRNLSLAWWKKGLAADPNNVPLGLAMAEHDALEDRMPEAWERLESLSERAPNSLEVALLIERVADQRQWKAERRAAIKEIERLGAAAGRENPVALRRLIDFATSRSRDAERTRRIEQLFQVEPSLRNHERLIRQFASVGNRERALALTESLEQHAEELPVLAIEAQASLWQELRQLGPALELRRRLVQLRPDSATALDTLGDLCWEAASGYWGEIDNQEALRSEAAQAYRQSLEVQPGRVSLLDRVRVIENGDIDWTAGDLAEPGPSFWSPYAIDGDRAIETAPPIGTYPEAAAVLLVDQMVTHARAEGGGEEMIHQVIQLTSREAVEKYSELTLSGDVERLRVVTADGQELQPTAQVGGGSYTLPGLAEGTFIEYRTIRRFDLPRERDLAVGPFFFQDPSGADAFHYTEWTVLLPTDWNPKIVERNLRTSREESTESGRRVLRWIDRGVGAKPNEFRAPPTDIALPNVQIRSERSWSETIELLQANAQAGYRSTPVLTRAAREILTGTTDRREQVERLYAAVCERIKSDVGGEEATEIWLEEGGDRDRALAGLLTAAGIDFQWVYAARSAAMRPFADWSIPTPGHFEYPLLRVELDDGPLFITSRFRRAQMGRIPLALQGGRGLLLSSSQRPRWIEIPTQDRRDEARVARARLRLTPDSVYASGALELRMLEASNLKDQLSGVNDFQRRSTIETFARQSFPGAREIGGDILGLDDPSEPLRITFELQSAQLIQTSGNRSLLKPIFFPAQLRRNFVRKGKRTLDYVGDTQDWIEEENRIQLGDAYRLAQQPEDLYLAGPWGSYQLVFELQGRELVVRRTLALEPFQIEAERVAELYAFCDAVDRKESEQLVLEKLLPR